VWPHHSWAQRSAEQLLPLRTTLARRQPIVSFAQSPRRPQLAAVGLASGAAQVLDLAAQKVRLARRAWPGLA
jgi:hypothetical protein